MDCSLSQFLAIFELHNLLLPGFGPSSLSDAWAALLQSTGAGVRLAGLLMVCIHQVPSKKLLRHFEAEEFLTRFGINRNL